MDNNISVNILKKEIQKAIVNELLKKEIIDFCQFNNIIKKIDEDIIKLESKLQKSEDITNMVVEVFI